MVKYAEGIFDPEYIQTLGEPLQQLLRAANHVNQHPETTLGVNFMEKSIIIRNTEIIFSIWDLGGNYLVKLVAN